MSLPELEAQCAQDKRSSEIEELVRMIILATLGSVKRDKLLTKLQGMKLTEGETIFVGLKGIQF